MKLFRYLQHWLSGREPCLQVAEFVPETHPIRQWADMLPWAALVAAVDRSLALRFPKLSTRGGDPIVFGPKSSNFSNPLSYGYFPRTCSFSGKETLGRALYRDVDCLTGFSARKSLEHSELSTGNEIRKENPGLLNHGKSDRFGPFPIGSPIPPSPSSAGPVIRRLSCRLGRRDQHWWKVVVLRWDTMHPSNPSGTRSGSVRPDASGVIRGRTRRDSLALTGHQASIFLVWVSAPPVLMATFTASSIGSLKGTSIRSRPCS
jgi:hypothetical protein